MSVLYEYFGVEDGSEIKWSHAVNDRATLRRALNSTTNMIEADVILSSTGELIMAHPPNKTSDLTLHEFISSILNATSGPKRGFKLDFKEMAAVEPALNWLKTINTNKMPIMLNADIVSGPGGGRSIFDPNWFIHTCRTLLPSATLSLGWSMSGVSNNTLAKYSATNINDMLYYSNRYSPEITHITFAVEVRTLRNSWNVAQALLADTTHSLTLWQYQPVDAELANWINENIVPVRAFYDITYV
jgi:hypothetical protein